MKIKIGILISITIIILMFAVNYFLRPENGLILFGRLSENAYEEISQIIVVSIYLLAPLFLLTEKGDLQKFNLDQVGLMIFIASSTLTIFEVSFKYFCIIILSTLWLIALAIKRWAEIPKTNLKWIVVSVFSSLFMTLLTVLVVARLSNDYDLPITTIPKNYLLLIIIFGIPVAKEEILFRSVLLGYLGDIIFNKWIVFTLQALLFWLIHGETTSGPWFYISLPLATLTYSLLAIKSKQITPSILAHLIFNVSQPIFVRLFGI